MGAFERLNLSHLCTGSAGECRQCFFLAPGRKTILAVPQEAAHLYRTSLGERRALTQRLIFDLRSPKTWYLDFPVTQLEPRCFKIHTAYKRQNPEPQAGDLFSCNKSSENIGGKNDLLGVLFSD